MEPIERTCGICGKTFKPRLLNFPFDCCDPPAIPDISSIRLRVAEGNRTEMYEYPTCPYCAIKILKYIIDIQKTRPKKCEFCEFERGPVAIVPMECRECSAYNNFQLKKRMHPHQSYEWDLYKRYLCGEE